VSTVAEIKRAIDQLSPQEYCELMSALHDFEDDDWDRKMKADARAGRFSAMNLRADGDYEAGRIRRLEDLVGGKP
jgi:hypothetical protein